MILKRLSEKLLVAVVMVAAAALLTPPVLAERVADRPASDPDTQDEMARLLEIAKQGRAAARRIDGDLNLAAHPAIGSKDAPLVMVELGSFQCGFCRKHFMNTMPEIKSSYIDTGKLRYVFFDFALDPRHEHAAKAAEAAHCANEQDRYWEFRGQLYANSKSLAELFLPGHAEAAGLEVNAFQSCLDSGRHASRPAEDRVLSRQLKVRGTPSFFIGRPQGDSGRITLVKRISGARTMDFFAEQLDPLYAQLPRRGEVISELGRE